MNKKIIALILCLFSLLGSQAYSQIVAGRGIEIRIQGVPPEEKARIDGLYTVSGTGTVRMPLLNGEISISGLSPTAAAVKLESAYKNAGIYTTPTFQIQTSASDSVRQDVVTISGYVRAPGPKPHTPGMTLFQAVAAGGGANEFGDIKRVLLMRGKNSREYNLNNMQDRNIVLQANDTIDIPEKSINPFR